MSDLPAGFGEALEEYMGPPIPENSVTSKQVAEARGISQHQASKVLNQAVKAGRMTRTKNGKTHYFCLVEAK